jgi:hypothetical protein
MMTGQSEEELYKHAEKRTNEIVGFFIHAAIYVVVNAGIWAIDIATGGGIEWAYWTTIPWGIGLAVHGLVLLFELRIFGEEWRQRRIERYVERHRGAPPGTGSA